jgi:hypothetical protein
MVGAYKVPFFTATQWGHPLQACWCSTFEKD